MYGWRFALGIGFVGFAGACGGEVGDGDPVSPAATGGVGAATGGKGAVAGAGGRAATGGAGFGAGGSGGAASSTGGTFIDPGCPTIPPPPARKECDPLNPMEQCPFGTGCYPFVEHPYGSGCDAQTYGSECLPAGSGVQGAACGAGTLGCAPSFICVVGAHPGKHCAKLCTFDGATTCPPGMICGDVDIEGYGVCF